MNLLLCIRIGPKLPISYYNPIESYVKARLPSTLSFDCDNHSDNTIIRYVLDLLKEAAKSMVVIQAEPNAHTEVLGNLRLLIEHLIKTDDAVQIACVGTHPTTERMLGFLSENKVWKNLNETELCQRIEAFLHTSENKQSKKEK